MAITNAWTDPDTLEWAASDVARAADLNSVLGNLKYLHARPRFTLAHSLDQTIPSGTDTTLTWDTEIEDVGNWFDSGSPTVAVVPEDGVYLLVARILWDGVAGGQRKARFARDGNLINGDTAPAVSFAEHSLVALSSMAAGASVSVSMYHDDTSTDHDVLSDNAPWRSPVFMGVWLMPYIASL